MERQANSRASIMNDLDVGIIRSVQEELFQLNAFAQTYKSPNVRTDLRRYNKLTAVDVAELIVNERVTITSTRREGRRDLLVGRQGGGLLRIFKTWAQSDLPDAVPTNIPRGELGWPTTTELSQARRNGSYTLTAREFYAYRLYGRDNDNSLILRSDRLLQHYYVDHRKQEHRMEVLSDLRDMGMNDVDGLGSTGKAVILPASFTGSDRYYDAMALVRCFGPPDLFITITCSSKWQEIMENLVPRKAPVRDEYTSTIQSLPDRPGLIACVFQAKLKAIIKDNKANKIFRASTVSNGHSQHDAWTAWCIASSCCVYEEKQVLKIVSQSTDENGFPAMMRRDSDRTVVTKNKRVENRPVIPYNSSCSHKYNGPINVEVCGSRGASVKYLYKYIYQGSDLARVSRQNGQRDEIKEFLNARDILNVESCWRILDYPTQDKSHSVTRRSLHIETKQIIIIRANERSNDVINRAQPTKLTRFFELCASEGEDGERCCIMKFPCTSRGKGYNKLGNSKAKRQQGLACSPLDIERYRLRLLLCNVKGPKSFEDVRTVDSTVYPSFRDACRALGLLDDDAEWHATAPTVRGNFGLSDIRKLWENYLHCMSEDYQQPFAVKIEESFVRLAKCLQDYPSLPQLEVFADISVGGEQNPPPRAEQSFNLEQLEATAAKSYLLNEDQSVVYERVIETVRDPDSNHRCFFLDSPGGTGKSFVLEQIFAHVRLDGRIAIPVACSGIAALLLTGGRTVPSRFKLPLELTEVSICSISKQSNFAGRYREMSLITWDGRRWLTVSH
ncbi:TPA: LOW QUALITY PROTEIN: hypothetical protein N0F65_007271 [Lagenidium giganteum]|uniref:ATP-dependent DNA helicase n=1 Tax=Lagenidium giganteum TaxID=4803 RepID=A0AAV2YV97_9STRA|nr:TPA: LOW QUALITY PROTEIN: hypothetical protein N0F65_007271 [Lagenidium giganteum]